MLYDYRTIHRSGINRSGKDRQMLQVNYFLIIIIVHRSYEMLYSIIWFTNMVLLLQVNFCRSWYRDVCNKVPGGMF